MIDVSKVVLLVHPVHSGGGQRPAHRRTPAPGAAPNLLADALAASGCDVVVVDELWMTLGGRDTTSADAWVEECSRMVQERGVTVLAVTMLTYFRALAHKLIVEIAARYPHVRIVVGGPHAVFRPDRITHFTPQVDAVFTGEADAVIVEVVDAVVSGSPPPAGLLRRGAPVLDTGYRMADPSGFRMPSYSHYPEPIPLERVVMMTSRGCPTPFCTFCGITAGGGKFRTQNLGEQRADLRRAAAFGVSAVEFHDSVFTLRSDQLHALFEGVDLGGITEFYCHTRPNDITPQVIDSLARTGARWRVFVGLETADTAVRLGARKSSLRMETFAQNARIAANAGVDIGVFLIFGLPGESIDSMRATYELLEQCQPAEVFASPLKYIPGSTLHRAAVADGVLDVDTLIDPAGPPGVHVQHGEALLESLAAVEVFTSRFDRSREHNRVEQSYTRRLADPEQFALRVENLRSLLAESWSA